MEQRMVQIGNSAGVIIPAQLRKLFGMKAGSKISVKKAKNGVFVSPLKVANSGGVDAKFMQMVDEFMDEHDKELKELAKR
jgi:putative addiction module antidote